MVRQASSSSLLAYCPGCQSILRYPFDAPTPTQLKCPHCKREFLTQYHPAYQSTLPASVSAGRLTGPTVDSSPTISPTYIRPGTQSFGRPKKNQGSRWLKPAAIACSALIAIVLLVMYIPSLASLDFEDIRFTADKPEDLAKEYFDREEEYTRKKGTAEYLSSINSETKDIDRKPLRKLFRRLLIVQSVPRSEISRILSVGEKKVFNLKIEAMRDKERQERLDKYLKLENQGNLSGNDVVVRETLAECLSLLSACEQIVLHSLSPPEEGEHEFDKYLLEEIAIHRKMIDILLGVKSPWSARSSIPQLDAHLIAHRTQIEKHTAELNKKRKQDQWIRFSKLNHQNYRALEEAKEVLLLEIESSFDPGKEFRKSMRRCELASFESMFWSPIRPTFTKQTCGFYRVGAPLHDGKKLTTDLLSEPSDSNTKVDNGLVSNNNSASKNVADNNSTAASDRSMVLQIPPPDSSDTKSESPDKKTKVAGTNADSPKKPDSSSSNQAPNSSTAMTRDPFGLPAFPFSDALPPGVPIPPGTSSSPSTSIPNGTTSDPFPPRAALHGSALGGRFSTKGNAPTMETTSPDMLVKDFQDRFRERAREFQQNPTGAMPPRLPTAPTLPSNPLPETSIPNSPSVLGRPDPKELKEYANADGVRIYVTKGADESIHSLFNSIRQKLNDPKQTSFISLNKGGMGVTFSGPVDEIAAMITVGKITLVDKTDRVIRVEIGDGR